MEKNGNTSHFLNEAFRHCKTVAALGEGVDLIRQANFAGITITAPDAEEVLSHKGVVTASNPPELRRFMDDFIQDRKSTRLNSSHVAISYAVFCLKKKKKTHKCRHEN